MHIMFLIIAIFSIFTPSLFAVDKYYGVVVVHEAPLLNRPNLENAQVVQQLKRGERIYINPQDIPPRPYEPRYSESLEYGKIVDGPDSEGFFHTLDAMGSDAYIERRYVKVIYNDEREFASGMRPFDPDPTDYRLEEPLPDGYPLYSQQQKRAEFAFATGPSQRTIYPYAKDSIREDYGRRMGITINYAGKLEDDPSDRFYFGWQSHLLFQNTELFFNEFNVRSRESMGQVGLGPVIIYNFHRTETYRLSVTGGATFNYHRALIEMQDDEMLESRLFDGFSVTPKIAGHYVRRNFFPVADLLLGAEMQFNFNHSLKPLDDGGGIEQFWNANDDRINLPTGGIFTVFLGFQTSY